MQNEISRTGGGETTPTMFLFARTDVVAKQGHVKRKEKKKGGEGKGSCPSPHAWPATPGAEF